MSILSQKGEKPMCLIPLFYFQPLSLNNYCWWLKQLMIVGAGVAGLSVLTHTHTLPTILAVHLLTQTFIFTPRVAEHPRLQIHVLLEAIHLHALPIWLLIAFTHRNFSWVLTTRFSSAIRVLSIAGHSHAEDSFPVFGLTHRNFWVLPT